MESRTYNKRYGMLNSDGAKPVVVYAGVAWLTKNGIPVMYPDQTKFYGGTVLRIPKNIPSIKFDGEL